jgi:hypothetical protein
MSDEIQNPPPAKKSVKSKSTRPSKPAAKSAPNKTSPATKATKVDAKRHAPTELQTKSKRTFPVNTLEDARKIADAIKQFNMGNPWAPGEIAQALGMGAGSSTYYYLTAASRDHGLTVGTRDTAKIELTDLGRSLAYPKSLQEAQVAVVAAFRKVDLYEKVYDYYQGENLPDIQYLKNTLKTEFGVAEQFQDQFYDLYQANLAYVKSQGATLDDLPKTSGANTTPIPGNSSIILGESKNAGDLVAFVAMPFSERSKDRAVGYFDEVLKHLITPAAVKANFNARTAKKSGTEVIQSTIVNDLDNADLVIVDLTEHNPNVLFELGMRIAFNKPVCLIRAKGTPPIFDIDHMLRVFDYNPSLWPSTLAGDIPALSEFIAETWRKKDSERSYLSILRETK